MRRGAGHVDWKCRQLSRISGARLEASNILKVRPNGPNVVTGRVVLAGARTTSAKAPVTLVLCRCGLSQDKPFCDGTHTRMGFAEPGLLPADAQPGTAMIGEVTITPTRNGPLECRGPLTVQGADGRTSATEETWLCRCGHSRTKPFCDGSHKRVGFRS
jgi:CDGSH-type Zn-finger protein